MNDGNAWPKFLRACLKIESETTIISFLATACPDFSGNGTNEHE